MKKPTSLEGGATDFRWFGPAALLSPCAGSWHLEGRRTFEPCDSQFHWPKWSKSLFYPLITQKLKKIYIYIYIHIYICRCHICMYTHIYIILDISNNISRNLQYGSHFGVRGTRWCQHHWRPTWPRVVLPTAPFCRLRRSSWSS